MKSGRKKKGKQDESDAAHFTTISKRAPDGRVITETPFPSSSTSRSFYLLFCEDEDTRDGATATEQLRGTDGQRLKMDERERGR